MSSPEFVLVTTISHFRLKYAIPLAEFEALGFGDPIDSEKLSAYLTDGNAKEFSQVHLGEQACDVSVYTEGELLDIFDVDNSYLAGWPTTQKVEWLNDWQEDVA